MGDPLVLNMPTPMSLTVYRGEVGPAGPPGPTGATGPQGLPGATTITGTALSVAADGALTISGDTALYREAANLWRTPDSITIDADLDVGGDVAVLGTVTAANLVVSGSITGIDKTDVGLANVNNTSDASKPVSTATQTALDLKANLASPAFTGTITIGGDCNLFRSSADVIGTADSIAVGGNLAATIIYGSSDIYARNGSANGQVMLGGTVGGKGGIYFGSANDAALYRDAAQILRMTGELRGDGNIRANFNGGAAGVVDIGAYGPSSQAAVRLGTDVSLYRSAANEVKTDDALIVGGNVGFYNTAATAKQTVTGSRGGNAALASLLTALATVGLITNSSSA